MADVEGGAPLPEVEPRNADLEAAIETGADAPEPEQAADPDAAVIRAEAEERVPETVTLRALGGTVDLLSNGDPFLRDDSLWRLRTIYERVLAANILPPTGTLVDVGAGFGVLAIPFARAFPDWTVWAFEPEPSACAALRGNVAALGLGNVVVVEAAVVGPAEMSAEMAAAVARRDGAGIAAAAGEAAFLQSDDLPGYLEFAGAETARPGHTLRQHRAVPASLLRTLRPDVLKLVAPGIETEILAALEDIPLPLVTGEMWKPVPSASLIGPARAVEQVYLPLAGTPLILRRGQGIAERHPAGLDVVVAMYNAEDYIEECIASIIDNEAEDIRAVVVDDGAKDRSAEVVRRLFDGHPRVELLQKANGGCASARNYGRAHSGASHVTFVDADDAVDGDLYPKLLELARYSGAEVVQGRFDWMVEDAEGQVTLTPSYEAETLAHHRRIPFGAARYFVVPSHELVIGQPAIWRRIYRRDFLDNKKIWFPEHIRAFDDQIFQLESLILARDVYCRDDVAYRYRQHPGQDIKAGDERFFHSLEMFRLVFKRAIAEGWNDFSPLLRSYVNTINWIHAGLRADLQPRFLIGAAELWVYAEMALGEGAFGAVETGAVEAADFPFHVAAMRGRLEGQVPGYAWIHLDAMAMHPEMMRATGARG